LGRSPERILQLHGGDCYDIAVSRWIPWRCAKSEKHTKLSIVRLGHCIPVSHSTAMALDVLHIITKQVQKIRVRSRMIVPLFISVVKVKRRGDDLGAHLANVHAD
jgi:hypothetical protein